jgi:serine/threonine-protein kinase
VTHSRWDRLESLLEQARALPASEREAFIERASGDDPALGSELASLVNASDGAEEYFGRLRQDLLGSGMQGILRRAAAAGDGPDPWIGRTVLHYEIVERIGGGGMGVIYRARDPRLGREVALKFIAPEIRDEPLARQRFVEEARAASALDHPNICTIHEIGETEDGRLFIVMPAYEGETLRSRLDRGPLPEADALTSPGRLRRHSLPRTRAGSSIGT